MGAAPEKRVPDENPSARALGAKSTKDMATPESPRISLVSTAQKAPAWTRTFFTLDTGFHGLMLGAALTVLAVVGLTLSELIQTFLSGVAEVWTSVSSSPAHGTR